MQRYRSTGHIKMGKTELHWDKEYGQVLQKMMMEIVHASSQKTLSTVERSNTNLFTSWVEPAKEGDVGRNQIKKVIRLDELFRSLSTAIRELEEGKNKVRWTRQQILIGLSLQETVKTERKDGVPEILKKKNRHSLEASQMQVNEKKYLR